MSDTSISRKRPCPRGAAAYPRKRAVGACQTCRSRKTKCDNRRPICSFCEKAGTTCSYSHHDPSEYDPASLAILSRIDQIEDNIKVFITSTSWSGSVTTHDRCSETASPSTALVDRDASDQVPLRPSLDERVQLAHLPPNTVEDILGWEVWQERFEGGPDLLDLLRSSRLPAQQPNASFELDADTCRQLLQNCLDHVLSKNPVLEPRFLQTVMHGVCMNGIGWDANSCLALLICALGIIAPLQATEADRISARSYFGAAQRRLGSLMHMDDLIVPQCYFLCGVYFMYNLRPYEAWKMFAQGVVCTLADSPSQTSKSQYSLKECIHWSCWKSEIELRLHLKMPGIGVTSDQYPQHFPEPPASAAAHGPTWYYYLGDISLRRLDSDIRQTILDIWSTTRPDTRYSTLARALPDLEEQLREWRRSMPDVFSILDPEENVLYHILEGRLLDSFEALYIPFLGAALDNSIVGKYNLPEIDRYARKALDCCMKRMAGQEAGIEIRHHGIWLALRTCARSALMLLAARFAGRSEVLPHQWQSAIISAARSLSLWQNESLDVRRNLGIIRDLCDEIGLDLSPEAGVVDVE